MSNVDILVIGGSGFIGAHIVKAAVSKGYRVAYTYANHKVSLPARAYQVTVEQANVLETCITDTRPRIVVYCAKPELQAKEATHVKVNVKGVRRVLASLHYAASVLFVYLSTDTVFSGKHGPYREDSPPDPAARKDSYRAYAVTKCEGERVALANWSNTIVARTCIVNGRDVREKLNPCLALPMAHLLAGQPLARFCDRYISPTLVNNLAEALLEVIEPDFTYRGILHLAGSQRVTDYEYGRYLARRLGIDESLIVKDLMAESPLLANGPRDASLDTTFTQGLLNTRLLQIEEQLAVTFPTMSAGC